MVNCINLIIEMSPRFILGRENMPCVAEVVNRSLKADCTDYTAGVGPTPHIGPLFPEFRGWPLWFMASIALRGPHQLAPEVVPGASLHFEALTPECGRECLETGDCGPARHVGARQWGLLGLTGHGC